MHICREFPRQSEAHDEWIELHDATDFIVHTDLEVFEGDTSVHRLEPTISIPRDGV
jgi:hypothetical protein